MKYVNNILISVFLLLTFGVSAQSRELTGKVTCQGKGIANVVVSDGSNCTRTKADGSYRLYSGSAAFVFISTPAGYLTKVENSVPVFSGGWMLK